MEKHPEIVSSMLKHEAEIKRVFGAVSRKKITKLHVQPQGRPGAPLADPALKRKVTVGPGKKSLAGRISL